MQIYRVTLLLVLQFASLAGVIYFVMWTPVYDVVVWNKSVLESLKDIYYNVIYAVISLALFLFATFYVRRFLAQIEPVTYSKSPKTKEYVKKPQATRTPATQSTRPVGNVPRIKCPKCDAIVYENVMTCPFCGWNRP